MLGGEFFATFFYFVFPLTFGDDLIIFRMSV